MHLIRKLKRMGGLLADGGFKAVKDKIFYEIESRMTYSRLLRKYSKFIAENTCAELPARGGGHDDVIWWLWLQGEDNAPPICKACLKSLRRWYPEKKIIVLDKDNLSGYITLPDHIEQKHKDGKISHTHYSDILRSQLLIEHGGIWIDATVYCTGREHYGHVMHLPLFVFRDDTPSRPLSTLWPAENWFIVSDPNDPILELTQKLLFQYWKDYDYVIHYFIFYMFFRMAAGAYLDEYNKMPFISSQPSFAMRNSMYDDYSEERMRKFEEACDFHKMNHRIDISRQTPSSIIQHVIDSYK